jgi:regulation of enolase protein 1 (concanavalin A-like superfamily)
MIRENEKTWLKSGIEFVKGTQYASTVVTREYSDWSIIPLSTNPESLWLKLEHRDGSIKTSYSLDGEQYNMMRLAYLTATKTVQVGLMCASPERKGFQVVFNDWQIQNLDAIPK